jgi:hypothetical protein
MITSLLKMLGTWLSTDSQDNKNEDMEFTIPPAVFIRIIDCSQEYIYVYVQIDDPDAFIERTLPGVILGV